MQKREKRDKMFVSHQFDELLCVSSKFLAKGLKCHRIHNTEEYAYTISEIIATKQHLS
jgi:hypothetical protein